MTKKYNNKVIQYSLKGEIINEFANPTLASKSVSNYDSIINCCLGKYKTSSGYIFRFEGDPLNIDSKVSIDKNTHFCSICNSQETIRSMAMHLRFAHNLNTEEYVKSYGEFRPKLLKEIKKQETSQIECKVCSKKLNSNQHLMYHITQNHPEITQSEYILKYMFANISPLCKCGCGENVTLLRNGKNNDLKKDGYCRDYVKGHTDTILTRVNL